MNMGGHAILYLAFSFQFCGFDATNPYWYRRPRQQRISTSHVPRRSCSEMPHAYKWDACPWIGLLILLADPILPDPRFLLMFPAANNNSRAFPACFRSRWRQDALQTQPQMLQRTTGCDGCGSFLSEGLRCITWNTRGLVGSVFSRQRNREFKLQYPQMTLGQQQHYLSPLFSTFLPDNVNAGGSAICIHRDLLREEATVSLVITFQGRDHFVNIQSGRHNLVIVNVHFEPELTLQITSYSPALACLSQWCGRYFGDFNICDPEEGLF